MLLRVGSVLFAVALALAVGMALAVFLSNTARTTGVASEGTDAKPLAESEADESGWNEGAENVAAPNDPSRTLDGDEDNSGSESSGEARLSGMGAPSRQTDNGPEPTPEEIAATNGPRYYEPRSDAAFTLTIERLGLYDMPVADSRSPRALDSGPVHVPETPMPWSNREQKNVYVAAHRFGVPGTNSRLAFYRLDRLEGGDRIVLEDGAGNVYRYRVTEKFEVSPSDVWVMDTVLERDILTLQTCTPIPTFEKRLIVRAERG